MGEKVVWFSRYEPLPAQKEELKRLYGENVEIIHVKRRFESKEHLLNYIATTGAKVVYAPLPPDALQELKNTKIGSKIIWLMCEWGELKDGVRKEEERGFDPNSDYVRYAYNIGLHRRFLGFKEFVSYNIVAKPLSRIQKVNEGKKEYIPKEEYRKKWARIYRELENEYEKNKVIVKVRENWINVKMDKDCQMNEELRPILKEIGFSFNPKYKDWGLKVEEGQIDDILDKIREHVRATAENITVRILQKYNEPETKAEMAMERIGAEEKIYKEEGREDEDMEMEV